MLPALLLASFCALDGELGPWLERAGSTDWAERERAQRWLATHLELSDAGALAARAQSGDAEVRARLARAIGGEERLLELAALLALRSEPAAAELGREALREQLLAFDPGAEEAPGESFDWLAELRLRFPERLALSAELRGGPPGELLELLARRVPAAPALVLDPRARDARSPAAAAELAGTLPEILLQCASERELSVQGFGFAPESEGRPWILLAPAAAAPQSTAALLSGWVLGAADPAREPGQRAACARSLAATGWPAALRMLEARWTRGDEAPLSSLLRAAARGRAVPSLLDPARQRTLYSKLAALVADERDRESLASASGIARALAGAGPLSPQNEPLGPLALEGFDRASPRERWLRLVVLEGQGRAFPEALAAADLLLAASDTPAPLALEALRLRAALYGTSAPPRAPADPVPLLDWAVDSRRRAELRDLWSGLALPWPASWNGLEARGSALPAETRSLLLQLAWLAEAREPALAQANALCADRSPRALDALVDALAALGARSQSSARALADLLPAGSEPAILLAGLPPGPREEQLLARTLKDGPHSGLELRALATQAASPRGADVRARLLESLSTPLSLDERLAALDRAARELALHATADDLDTFATAARERARTLGPSDLRARLRPGRWPTPPSGPPRDLERDERDLSRW